MGVRRVNRPFVRPQDCFQGGCTHFLFRCFFPVLRVAAGHAGTQIPVAELRCRPAHSCKRPVRKWRSEFERAVSLSAFGPNSTVSTQQPQCRSGLVENHVGLQSSQSVPAPGGHPQIPGRALRLHLPVLVRHTVIEVSTVLEAGGPPSRAGVRSLTGSGYCPSCRPRAAIRASRAHRCSLTPCALFATTSEANRAESPDGGRSRRQPGRLPPERRA